MCSHISFCPHLELLIFACLYSCFCLRGRKVAWPKQWSENWEVFLLLLWMFCVNMGTYAMFLTPIPASWLFSFLFHVTLPYISSFLTLFLCEWTTSGLTALFSCLRSCFHIYKGMLENLTYYRKHIENMLSVLRAYLSPLLFCYHSLNKLLQNIFENKGT